ncbi:MAG: HAD-IIIA family hydrolase [Phycisphaerae bacterium]|nr:HAD-IIIA family hydrolase [Phycisphaerae bacterium]
MELSPEMATYQSANSKMPLRPAVFLDRDGTLIEHVHYLADAALVRILPGVPEALRLFREHGFACIVTTNQSVIEKGLLDQAGLELIHSQMAAQLSRDNAFLDAMYVCPRSSISNDLITIDFLDRKPGPGMLLRAAAELGIDLARSWMIGDSISDVLAGHHAGCRGAIWLIDPPPPDPPRALSNVRWHAEANLLAAAREIILRQTNTSR